MNFNTWLETVPIEITHDALWNMEVYRLIAWADVCKLAQDRRMLEVSDQLYRAVGSISANIAEGYSKASKKDEARYFEYALGSAREARDWYYKARPILGEEVVVHRMRLLVQIIRQLLVIIPEVRGRKISDEPAVYQPYTIESLLEIIPSS